jgi:nucleotide-binding universal stress UspA family protein
MYSNILLAVDLAHEASWSKALPQAAELARMSGGKLHILGIVHELGSAMVASYLPKDYEQQALQHMKKDLEAFMTKHVPAGVDADTHVGHGHVTEVILHTADQIGADLIVMASHPPDQLRTFLVGSHADKVVHHAKGPVLIIR